MVMSQLSHHSTFKDFYLYYLCQDYKNEFSKMISYNRFIELMPMAFKPMLLMPI